MKKIISTALLLGSLVSITSCKDEPAPKANVKPFPVIEVEQRTMTTFKEFPTSIEGVNNNDVRAKIQGYIQEVLVDEGQYVTKGQILFRLETNALSQTTDAAFANVNAASANIKSAQAGVDVAQVEVDRLIPLVEKGIISNVQLETAKAQLLRAKSQVEQAKAAHHQAQSSYKSASATSDYAVIRAPISGVVGKINHRVGSLVGPTDMLPITTVSDTRELYAYFSMNESEYMTFLSELEGKNVTEKLKNIPLVELILPNGQIYNQKGKVSAVTGQINPQTGSIQFRVSFPNDEGLLTNGNSGKVKIPRQFNNAIVIPESSTTEQQGLIYVYKVVNDTAKSTVINVIDRVNNIVLVESGVQVGDKIVATGLSNLKNNTPVQPQITTIDSIINNIKQIF